MNYLADCEVIKLREYSRSYGSPETVKYPLIVVHKNSIDCYNAFGSLIRTFRRGTKLLESFTGKSITERTFKMRVKKMQVIAKKNKEEFLARMEEERRVRMNGENEQGRQLTAYFKSHPGKAEKLAEYMKTLSSKKWRSVVRLKVCRWIADGKFENLQLTPPGIRTVTYNFLNQ